MAITNTSKDLQDLPRWAQQGMFRSISRYEGPAEAGKMLLSGRWDFTPVRLLDRVNAYNDELLAYAKRNHVTTMTLVWSPGFSHEGDEVQWEILRQYIPKAHRKGIKIVLYHSLTNCFWQEVFPRVPEANEWRQLDHDGSNVPYMAATYHGEVSRILMCVNNRGWRDYFKEKVRLALEAGADGLFFDNLFSKCFCPVCRQGFAEHTQRVYGQAYEMPAPEKITEDELQTRTGIEVIADSDRNFGHNRSFLQMARSDYWNISAADFLQEVWDMARSITPELLYSHNAHERWPMNEVCNFKLSEDDKPSSYDPATKALWTNVGLWKYLLEDGGRQKPFLNGVRNKPEWAEILACGGFGTSMEDEAYQEFHHRHGKQIYAGVQPLGRVGVVLRGLSPVSDRAPFFTHLARHNVQFDIVIYEQIERYDLGLYDLLILFDLCAMGSDTADRLGGYVDAGGHLIATGSTGLTTHNWRPRDRSCVADLLGVGGADPSDERIESRFGKGRVVYYPASIGDQLLKGEANDVCSQFIDDVKELGGRSLVELDAPDGVLATLTGRGRSTRIVHLINYRPEPVESVSVRLPACKWANVELLSPDGSAPQLEGVSADEKGVTFTVKNLQVYTVAIVRR